MEPAGPQQSEADAVRKALTSTATCSTSTVKTLEQLLSRNRSNDPKTSKHAQTRFGKATSETCVTQTRNTRAGKPRVKTTVIEICEEKDICLSAQDRFVLATQVANAAIKTLGDVLKLPKVHGGKSAQCSHTTQTLSSAPSARADSSCPSSSSGSGSSIQSRLSSAQVVHPRCLHAVHDSLRQRSLSRRTSSMSSESARADLGMISVAECARLAFAHLRSSSAQKYALKDTPPLQVENGMVAVIGKFVGLGLEDMAIKELRILKKRLVAQATGEEQMPTVKAANNESTVAAPHLEKESLASLLHFPCGPFTASALPVIINHQLLVLKILASKRRPSLIQAAVQYLELPCVSAPANLILKQAVNAEAVIKVARQLENHAQSLLSLCPSVSSIEDSAAADIKLWAAPDTTLRIQSLAFHVRHLWWTLSSHKGNSEKELLEPFLKCLSAFSRRSTLAPITKYETAKKLYGNFMSSINLQSDSGKTNGTDENVHAAIYELLGMLAQQASAIPEAVNWILQQLEFLQTCRATEAKLASTKAKLAALIVNLDSLPPLFRASKVELVSDVLKLLEGSLKGDSKELDELLAEIMRLRRAAMRWLCKNKDEEGIDGDPDSRRVGSFCESVVYASVRFAVRYVGSPPAKDASQAICARYEQRRAFVAKSVPGSVDSVVTCCKTSIANRTVRWETLDAALQHCQMLLTQVEDGSDARMQQVLDAAGASKSVFVKISNVYWAYYQHIKASASKSQKSEIARVLQKSIDALESRNSLEQQAGLLAVKWEKLGTHHAASGKNTDASEALSNSIRCYVQTGLLKQAADLAGTSSPLSIYQSSEQFGLLCKTISELSDTISMDQTSGVDVMSVAKLKELSTEEQGIMLELNLAFAAQKADRGRANPDSKVAQSAVSELLRIYTPAEYPIRRLRVVVVALRLANDDGTKYNHGLTFQEGGRCSAHDMESLGRDSGLLRYLDHLKASLYAYSALADDIPNVSLVKKAVSIWTDLVDSAEDWSTLQNVVDDVKSWIRTLETISEYLDMLALDLIRVPTITLLTKIHELQRETESLPLITSITRLSLAYVRMGYSGKGGLLLARARKMFSDFSMADETEIRWHIAYAEYLLGIGDAETGEQSMLKAKEIAEQRAVFAQHEKSPLTLSQRIRQYRLIADAYYVMALLQLEHGSLHSALSHAKGCVKLNQRAWAYLDKKVSSKAKMRSSASLDTGMESFTESLASMSLESHKLPVATPTSHLQFNGPSYWSFVPPLFRGLSLLSRVFARVGLLQEAVYYVEQALRVAEAAKANPFMAESLHDLSGYLSGSGSLADAQQHLEKAEICNKSFGLSKHKGHYHYSLGYFHESRGDYLDELHNYERAEAVIQSITNSDFVEALDKMPSADPCLEVQMSELSLGKPYSDPKTRCSPTMKKPSSTRVTKPAAVASKVVRATRTATVEGCPSLRGFQGTIMRRRARALLLQGKLEDVASLLAQAHGLQHGQDGRLDHQFVVVKKLLYENSKAMAADTVLGVISDSTISVPAMASNRRGNNSATRVSETALLSPPSKSPIKSSPAKRSQSKSLVRTPCKELLQQAQTILLDMQTTSMQLCSTAMVCQIGKLSAQVTMLLSAADRSRNRQFTHPLMASYSLESPSVYALQQTLISVHVEKRSTSRDDLLEWPSPQVLEAPNLLEANVFQKAFVDIVPPSWTAISINLSDSREELYVARYQAHQSPFILRLPLARNNSRDESEDVFGFEQGKAELLDIIELSNVSTQKIVDMSVKGAKIEWWAAREALDARLRDLLSNVETIWLGGFRGILSQHVRQPELLARLQTSFQNILDKHLPSRRKAGRRTKTTPPKIQLDAHVLELFVGLGDATNENLDLSEPLMDLLYFVVDILQFNGERNAYDEVDFDAMVPETIDALRSYHAAAAWSSPSDATPQHTILILDKQLQCIPWESLPCLQGLSVSRLPSLGALRQRICRMRRKSNSAEGEESHKREERVEVGSSNGAYVLNPGSDLAHTQSVFAGPLSALESRSSQWEGLTSEAPTAKTLTTYLTGKDIFLYFGHGSGAQYIRRRDVRKLDKCSRVVCLFGCSSAVLKEEGIWEPWGMVSSYLTAGWEDMGGPVDQDDGQQSLRNEGEAEPKGTGTAAVLGMLWDVTDKDCDRFAEKVLQEWGLFPSSAATSSSAATACASAGSLQAKTPARKGRARKADALAVSKAADVQEQVQKGKLTLSEAVAKGREACYLRYLNGAAAVVYGVPVYLK